MAIAGRSAMRRVELLKPITWFAPMWAFGCGVVSSGVPVTDRWWAVLPGRCPGRADGVRHQPGGQRLVRPSCGRDQRAGQADPVRRLPGRRGLYIAIAWTMLSLLVAAPLGRWGFGAAVVGLILGLGIQRPAVPAETEWLVGQCRLRRML